MDLDQIVASITDEVFSRITAAQNSTTAPVEAPSSFVSVPSNIAGCIEYCLLNPKARIEDVRRLCDEAYEHGYGSICVLPWYVSYAANVLCDADIDVCTMIGLPGGKSDTPAKGAEVREAVRNGTTVIDIAVNVEAIKSGNIKEARNDIEEVVAMAYYGSPKIRIVLENDAYTKKEKEKVCELAKICNLNGIYISNSTGKNRACAEDVRFVRSILGGDMEIKISGGITDISLARELLSAGANYLATSTSLNLVK